MPVSCAAVKATNLPFLNPYLDSVGAPNFQTGCNFAAGGATILPANAASTCPFSFGIQVAQFVRFKDQVLELLAKGISTILATTERRVKDDVQEKVVSCRRTWYLTFFCVCYRQETSKIPSLKTIIQAGPIHV